MSQSTECSLRGIKSFVNMYLEEECDTVLKVLELHLNLHSEDIDFAIKEVNRKI